MEITRKWGYGLQGNPGFWEWRGGAGRGSNWLLGLSLFSLFTVLEYWLGWCFINSLVVFPHVSPKRQDAVSAMALHLIHRRGSIIIHGNAGIITCSESLGTLANARRNVRLFLSSKSLWCRWGNTNAFKSRTFNTSQRSSLPFPKCLSNVCNVQTGWEPLRVWEAVDKTWVLSLMTKGCWLKVVSW